MHPETLSLTHLLREPRARDAGRRPPLILLLHGIGSDEADLYALAPHLDGRLLVVSARAPFEMGPGAYAWFNIGFTPGGIVADKAQLKASLKLLSGFIDELVSAYGADEGRVYVAGFSQGAVMGMALLLTRPAKLAGVVAMSGRFPAQLLTQETDRQALAGKRVLVTHGLHDAVLPVEHSRAALEHLKALPLELTYREYPTGHEVSMENLRDVSAWLTDALDARRD
jgi:phospholipase/carboxylesterase